MQLKTKNRIAAGLFEFQMALRMQMRLNITERSIVKYLAAVLFMSLRALKLNPRTLTHSRESTIYKLAA